MKVKIYIEGGGDGQTHDARFREGWTSFFQKAGLKGKMPKVIRGGGRARTFDLYRTAVANQDEDELPLLLVDSEELPALGTSPWEHLLMRDGWEKPAKAGADDAFLMVACMETWFLADRAALRTVFGRDFKEARMPAWPNLERVDKARVLDTIDRATNSRYTKGKAQFELLRELDPSQVEARCEAARRLLDRLRKA